jgi:tRNA (guanine37-N1)-methyltransferase
MGHMPEAALPYRFDIITLFPAPLEAYFEASVLGKAKASGLIEIHLHQLRDYATDKHRTVDDTPYGGGAGMVLRPEPLARAIRAVQSLAPERKTRTVLFSAKGPRFDQGRAREYRAEYDRLILICGRYEGVDERIARHYVDEELSIGSYVLTGGEVPAMAVVDAVARLLPGVLGNEESALDESYSEGEVLEYPQYTKPEVFEGHRVPEVLLSGHHAEIERFRRQHQKPS